MNFVAQYSWLVFLVCSLFWGQGCGGADVVERPTDVASSRSYLRDVSVREDGCEESSNVLDLSFQQISVLPDIPPDTAFLNISFTKIVDLAGLRDLGITRLHMRGLRPTNLIALAGLDLVDLDLAQVQIRRLDALKALPLTHLSLEGNALVEDLEVCREMPLRELNLAGCRRIRSIEPLADLELTHLNLSLCPLVTNITVLKNMPLKRLWMSGCGRVTDISALMGMPLERLDLSYVGVSDISVLEGMKLRWLNLHRVKGVTDLSPLRDMPLESLWFSDRHVTKGIEVVRALRCLSQINSIPASDFWERYDKGERNIGLR